MTALDTVEFLIVGQGLAGTLLGRAFESRGISFKIIDRPIPVSSSQVAAGLVHPVTGRRHAKSWLADRFLQFNEAYYEALHRETGQRFYHPVPGLEIASTPKECNDWLARAEEPDLRHLLQGSHAGTEYDAALQPMAGKFVMQSCGWMDLPGFLGYYRARWIAGGQLVLDEFSPQDVVFEEDLVTYREHRASAMVCCEGEQARSNPLWSWLPFDPVKGEILTVRIPDLPQEHILFRGMFLVPLGNQLFRAGSTYSWHQLDAKATPGGLAELLDKLAKVVRVPWVVTDHQAGVRPAVKGRRPLIGRHPQHRRAYLLNGFGSKGVLMGPLLTETMVEWLLGKGELIPETDIARFYATYPGQ